MAKIYLKIRKDNPYYYKRLQEWYKTKTYQDQMFFQFIKDIGESLEGAKLEERYIYLSRPEDMTVVDNHPHFVRRPDGSYRFNSRSKIFKSWLDYKEENYIESLMPLENLSRLLGETPETIIYYFCNNKILANITVNQKALNAKGLGKEKYSERVEDVTENTGIVFMKSVDFFSQVISEKGDRYDYERKD